jgi:type II secretory ATPase GspE/PulE/Tfp pilus assembly ATPase PilB-like protein
MFPPVASAHVVRDSTRYSAAIMIEIFKAAIQRGASDIHIKAGDYIRARITGELVPLTQQRLAPEHVAQICSQLITNPKDKQNLDQLNDYDCSWSAPGIGRFRVNILRQRGTLMVVMRVIPIEIPNFESLRLPRVLSGIAHAERGLVLVTGVTGSGKSSTLAAMIGYINQNRKKHVLTLEHPIEFLHRDVNSSITQREVGTDTESFETGLAARRGARLHQRQPEGGHLAARHSDGARDGDGVDLRRRRRVLRQPAGRRRRRGRRPDRVDADDHVRRGHRPRDGHDGAGIAPDR